MQEMLTHYPDGVKGAGGDGRNAFGMGPGPEETSSHGSTEARQEEQDDD
jgi:hypothetical protein